MVFEHLWQTGHPQKRKAPLQLPGLFKSLILVLTFLIPASSQAAEVFFNDVYKGLGGPYAEQSSSISISSASKVLGTRFSFISLNPLDVRYSGNNVPGFLVYVNTAGDTIRIRGSVSRPEKSGSTFRAVYFYTSDDNNVALGEAYLLVFPGFESVFAAGGAIGTSSDPANNALNALLDSQVVPVISVSGGPLSTFAACSGTASTAQSFSVSGTNLLGGITVTAPTGYAVSLSSASGYASSVLIPLPTGSTTIAATTVYVRLTASAVNGASGNILCSSTGASAAGLATGTAVVYPLPTATAGSNSPVTLGATLLLTSSGGGTYSWTGPNGFSSSQQNPSITNVTQAASGTYTVTVTSANNCVSTAQTVVSVAADRDNDGVPDNLDKDNDNDGILDAVENAACTPASSTCDTDGDGLPNYLDLDSDGDGIRDVTEAGGTDANGDGKADGNADSNGVPSSANGGLTPPNTDGDGASNPYDVDSDGDGISDNREGQGVYVAPSGKDTDNDGLDDAYDGNNGGTNVSPVDTDNDGKPDYLDVDSDADGIPDNDEAGNPNNPVDTDADGKPDYRDVDSNNDTIPDGETLLIYKSSSVSDRVQSDGTFQMSFTIKLKNNRDVPLTSVQVQDNLTQTFPSPVTFTVLSVTVSGTSLVRNTGFDGITVTNLLAANSTLAANATDSIKIVLKINPGSFGGELANTGTGTAVSKWGPVTRQSIDLSRSNGVLHGPGVPTRFSFPAVELFIADVLTPNGDGFNDRWIIVRPSNKQLSVVLYNRWGQEIYKNANYNNEWDGRGTGNFLGKELPNGTYFYVVDIIDRSTRARDVRKGSLTLKRPY